MRVIGAYAYANIAAAGIYSDLGDLYTRHAGNLNVRRSPARMLAFCGFLAVPAIDFDIVAEGTIARCDPYRFSYIFSDRLQALHQLSVDSSHVKSFGSAPGKLIHGEVG